MPKMVADKVLSWASVLDQQTIEQADLSSRAPFIEGHIALMPDAHLGYGVTIGSVIPTRGAIIPYAVGVDIGCGMAALRTDLTSADLPDDLGQLLSAIEQAIPARNFSEATTNADQFISATSNLRALEWGDRETNAARTQLGTLGSGNHFVEVCLDAEDRVWLVLHSGSRGIGNQLATRHVETAKGLMKQYFIDLADPNLAYLVEGTPEFEAYWLDLTWAQDYARLNREVMLRSAVSAAEATLGRSLTILQSVNCHHNYSALEHHHGKNVYVTRKGAIEAKAGQLGIIPGSMGTNSYIVRGLGNASAYNSAPHGAGRAMSRTEARKRFSADDLAAAMGDRTWLSDRGKNLVDEHPEAYKSIDVVMRDSADLVTIEHELHQILNYKGT